MYLSGGVARFMPVNWGVHFSFFWYASQYGSPRPWTTEIKSVVLGQSPGICVLIPQNHLGELSWAHCCLGSLPEHWLRSPEGTRPGKSVLMFKKKGWDLTYVARMVLDKCHLEIRLRYSCETTKDEKSVSSEIALRLMTIMMTTWWWWWWWLSGCKLCISLAALSAK